jgi:urate oxidase
MTYDTFKLTIFSVIHNSSRSIIEAHLYKLSIDFNVKYSVVVQDFNEYDNWWWTIIE